MSHPRVEEVSDSDADMSDPSEGDIDDFVESDILRAKPAHASSSTTTTTAAPRPAQQHAPLPHRPPPAVQMHTTTDERAYKSYQCLYPVYFDRTRSRAEGRRVPRALAVANPLALDIVQACAALRLPCVLEAGKLHPKDWANPGRVKVNLRLHQQHAAAGAASAAGLPRIANKHHLYLLVAKHLQAHPTTDASPSLRVEVRGAPVPPAMRDPSKPWPRPAAPRGWKVGELLPYYSPAMTGGGVSENFFKDMMKEMQQQAGPGGAGGMPDMASLLAAAAGGPEGAGAGAEAAPAAPGPQRRRPRGNEIGKTGFVGKGHGMIVVLLVRIMTLGFVHPPIDMFVTNQPSSSADKKGPSSCVPSSPPQSPTPSMFFVATPSHQNKHTTS
ncbi:hypothetical protein VTJ83DRAFT_6299 [Remersonia thermophila]|uniref:Signal recognition particle SEC65 subunit n=1 Tax=Remersonia thermophila TaxID=72144 RepID=A0ABR4D6K5_9PEZI